VPHQIGFYYFAVGKARRTGLPIKDVIEGLLRTIKQDVDEQSSHYLERREDPNAWQNIYTRDLRALFYREPGLTTKPYGLERLEELRKVYPEVDDLERIAIQGPNGTIIHILAEPRHRELFRNQLDAVIGKRRGIVEGLSAERRECEQLLEKVGYESSDLFSLDELASRGKRAYDGYVVELTGEQIERLRRLTQWCAEGEVPFNTILMSKKFLSKISFLFYQSQ